LMWSTDQKHWSSRCRLWFSWIHF